MTAENWVEYLSFVFFIVGFLLAVASGSELLSYVFVIFAGLMFARLWWRWKKNLKVIIVFLMTSFIFGFVLGNFYGSRKLSAVLFLLALWAGYELHERGYLKSLEF